MVYRITVQKSPEPSQEWGDNLFVADFPNLAGLQGVLNLCDNKRRISWLESLIIPVRTDTLGNFCQDFFLPSLFNEALKTKDVALKIFLCIMMPIYDVITFPIRLITVIPRCIYNAMHPKEAHLFYKYLIDAGVLPKDLSPGHVLLQAEWVKKKGILTTEKDILTTLKRTFNFMSLPKSVSTTWSCFSESEVPLGKPEL